MGRSRKPLIPFGVPGFESLSFRIKNPGNRVFLCIFVSLFLSNTIISHCLKTLISNTLRRLGLIYLSDKLRYYLYLVKRRGDLVRFKKEHPGVALPPSYLIYESFQLDYFQYYLDSQKAAEMMLERMGRHIRFEQISILDWGCGPARIIRHLPGLLPAGNQYFGTDYNRLSIGWDRKNISGIDFQLNGASPPLAYADHSFDLIYGISIFTHLPAKAHQPWWDELVRVAKPGALIYLTLHGAAFRKILNEDEKQQFDRGELVIRGNTRQGHRTFGAFQPEAFVKDMIFPCRVAEFIPGGYRNEKPQQDIWMIRVEK